MERLRMVTYRIRWVLCLLTGLSGVPAMAQALISGAGVAVTVQDLENDLLRAPPEARTTAFSRPEAVQNNISNIYVRRVLAAEALRDKLDQDPAVKAALDIARDRVLSDARLERIDEAKQPNMKALEAYALTTYKANPKRFEAPEQVKIWHILIRTSEPNARVQAEQILKELKAGANFEQMAKTRSQDLNNAASGGDLGAVSRGRMIPAFDEAAFKLIQPGDLSDVIETPFGFHIIKLNSKRPAGLLPFDEVKDTLIQEARTNLANAGRQAEKDRILSAATFDAAAIEAFAKSRSAK